MCVNTIYTKEGSLGRNHGISVSLVLRNNKCILKLWNEHIMSLINVSIIELWYIMLLFEHILQTHSFKMFFSLKQVLKIT